MVVNDAYLPLFESKYRYNVIKGGAGAGKSVAVAQTIITKIMQLPKYRVLALCKIAASISGTVFNELVRTIDDNGLSHLFNVTSSPQRITCISNGNEIIFRGMDDQNKLKSISGINLIWMEEADNFLLHDFLQANTRIRGKSDYPKQIFLTFNPTSELSWLKATFFDEGNPYQGKALVLETTYRDNHYLEPADIEALELTGKSDPNFKRVYMDGNWGQISTDGLFYKQFNSYRHVSEKATYNPELPLWLSFDFNVQPYCAATAWQVQPDNKTIYLVDEYTLRSPKNTTKYVCREFKRRHWNHTAGLFITGDPNGKKSDTRSEQGYNDYSIISDELHEYHPSFRVASKAPMIVPRGNFINAIFSEEGFAELSILINPKCKKTIEDLENQKEANGTKDKKKGKVNGILMELYGHCSDTLDYLLCQVFANQFEDYQRGKLIYKPIIGRRQTIAKFRL